MVIWAHENKTNRDYKHEKQDVEMQPDVRNPN